MFSRISWKDLSVSILHINTIYSRKIMIPARSVVNLHGRIEFFGNVGNKYLILVSFSLYYYILFIFNVIIILLIVIILYLMYNHIIITLYFRFAHRLESGKACLLR